MNSTSYQSIRWEKDSKFPTVASKKGGGGATGPGSGSPRGYLQKSSAPSNGSETPYSPRPRVLFPDHGRKASVAAFHLERCYRGSDSQQKNTTPSPSSCASPTAQAPTAMVESFVLPSGCSAASLEATLLRGLGLPLLFGSPLDHRMGSGLNQSVSASPYSKQFPRACAVCAQHRANTSGSPRGRPTSGTTDCRSRSASPRARRPPNADAPEVSLPRGSVFSQGSPSHSIIKKATRKEVDAASSVTFAFPPLSASSSSRSQSSEAHRTEASPRGLHVEEPTTDERDAHTASAQFASSILLPATNVVAKAAPDLAHPLSVRRG